MGLNVDLCRARLDGHEHAVLRDGHNLFVAAAEAVLGNRPLRLVHNRSALHEIIAVSLAQINRRFPQPDAIRRGIDVQRAEIRQTMGGLDDDFRVALPDRFHHALGANGGDGRVAAGEG